MAYQYGSTKTSARGQVLSTQEQIRTLKDIEERLMERISKLKRVEQIYRERGMATKRRQQHQTMSIEEVQAEAEKLLPQIHKKYQTSRVEGRQRILEILREIDAHNNVRRAPCGTEAGYSTHRRLEEPTCKACRKAHNERLVAWRERTESEAARAA